MLAVGDRQPDERLARSLGGQSSWAAKANAHHRCGYPSRPAVINTPSILQNLGARVAPAPSAFHSPVPVNRLVLAMSQRQQGVGGDQLTVALHPAVAAAVDPRSILLL